MELLALASPAAAVHAHESSSPANGGAGQNSIGDTDLPAPSLAPVQVPSTCSSPRSWALEALTEVWVAQCRSTTTLDGCGPH